MRIARQQSFVLPCFFLLLFLCCDQSFAQVHKNNNSPDVDAIAIVNGKRITRQEVDELIGSQLFNLEERINNLRKIALDTVIARVLLEEEAQSKRITVEELKKRLLAVSAEVKDAKVEELYDENLGGLGNMSEDEAKQRIKLDIEGRERIEQYRAAVAEMKKRLEK